jgi:uncharacterized membrane protein
MQTALIRSYDRRFHTPQSHEATSLMESSRRSYIPSSSGFAIPAARWTAVLALVMTAAYFAFKDAVPYLVAFSPKVYGPYWETRFWMLTHVAAGTSALLIGGCQIAIGLSGRIPGLHRWLGRAYVVAVLVSAATIAGLLSHGSVVGASFGALLGTIGLISTIYVMLGWFAARNGQIIAHRSWMIRSYMTMMVFALFRLCIDLPILEGVGRTERYTAILALTYFLILSSTEIALQSRAVREAPLPPARRTDDQAAFGSAGSSQLRFAHPPIGSD